MSRLPQVKGNRLITALRKEGWQVDRTHGSHVIMRNEGKAIRRIVVPVHGNPLKPGLLRSILKNTELSVEALKNLL